MNASFLALSTFVLASLSSGCAPSYGFTNSFFGNPLRKEFCDSVRTFVRESPDDEGLRRAWFLPFGYDEESIDFYAPMSAKPMDDAALAFYEQRAGQLTHYARAPEFAFEFSKCLTRRHGFAVSNREMLEDSMRGSFLDRQRNRIIELRATSDTTGILIASRNWNGNIDESLSVACSSECEIE
jgi:hypothetical protein